MSRSSDVGFCTTPEVYARLRKLAFLRGWTLSKCVHEVVGRGLPVMEEDLTEEDQAAWVELFANTRVEGA